jgi:hypothetical protein
MNSQEFFTKTVQHLRKQGKKAQAVQYRGDGKFYTGCVHLAADGCMCAIGCHLGDIYSSEMEGLPVCKLLEKYPEVAQLFADVDPRLLEDMQRLHDAVELDNWERAFLSVALTRNLVVPA